ncbi:hypothetical protein EMIHUDRAFT_416307 [Emiliania huxleyi CCMP1516]|uniref:TauD/TfdA-like domain-containing protein n=2 Tax=Emiliania huxleyi TaxID=2903 RepID=A0A0D3IT78_EMIH1|nr:hypothetical protein EMIHUDRAFT_416307 [Emiliania huxleyi CCMP1516]EOD14463.1 hypothetical protein EMIHUDRAFT_416307 [Emiliania huxleyi CCMP1516]|eukprot:XP_005766892.1 hypothetical protein EMIHUDRAFT_416307 [Emiliania huxleyi CCMP1516]
MISLLLACSARIALVDPPDSRSSRLPAPDGDLAVRPARRLTLLRGGGADGWEQIGARPVSIDEERVFAGRAFPMTLSPLLSGRTTLTEWAAEHREELLQLVRENGAVLLRGFGGMETPQGFSDFVMGLRLEEFGMGCSAAPRTEVAPGVFTANEAPQREETRAPPQEKIPFHHEMAQCEDKPAFLFFYCEFPAQTGGATPIIPSNAVATHLREACGHAFSAAHPAVAQRLAARGIRYARTLPAQDDPLSPIGKSWRTSFNTDTRQGAEAAMAAAGTTWRWHGNGDLYTETKQMPALVVDGRSGKEMFYNAVIAAITGWEDGRNDPLKAIRYGDGEELDGEAVAALLETGEWMAAHRVAFAWQSGDVLIIDNQAAMHSRETFTPPRRILASLWGEALRRPEGRAEPERQSSR